MAARYCTGLKIPWRHPNRHERASVPHSPPPIRYFQDCSPGGESFSHFGTACSRTRRHSTTLLYNVRCFLYIFLIFSVLFSDLFFFSSPPRPSSFLWNLNWRMVGRCLASSSVPVGEKNFLSGRVLLTPTNEGSFYERFRVF